MAAEEPKPLTYIPEVVLKRRKSSEEWALRRKEQLEQRRRKIKDDKMLSFKRAEEFIDVSRKKELDLILLKRRGKRTITELNPESKLLFVIRIKGTNEMHHKTRKILGSLRLGRIFTGVFVEPSQGTMLMLQKVEPYVTYGYPNLSSIRDLINKKGLAKINRQRVPLTSNNIIEEVLGVHGIMCMEDIVNEIVKVGPHFKKVNTFLWPFSLKKVEGGIHGKKTAFKEGGDAGNRGDLINELIRKMN